MLNDDLKTTLTAKLHPYRDTGLETYSFTLVCHLVSKSVTSGDQAEVNPVTLTGLGKMYVPAGKTKELPQCPLLGSLLA